MRDTSDVASNHDLAYARSADGGVTSSLGVLVWSPNWVRHQAQRPTPVPPASANLDAPLDQLAIAAIAQKSAHWQWQHVPIGNDYAPLSWTMAPFYLGALAVSRSMSNWDR